VTWVWILLGIVVVLLLFGIYLFNRIVRLRNEVNTGWSNIDVQLKRRNDLIPNLVEAVKGYAQHEKGVFEAVTEARAGAAAAAKGGSVQEKAEAQAKLDKAIIDVLAVAEAYPDLKASANFQSLQAELADTENKISFARQYYNDAVAKLNGLVRTIPWLLFTGIAGVHAREFYEAPEGQATPPAVSF